MVLRGRYRPVSAWQPWTGSFAGTAVACAQRMFSLGFRTLLARGSLVAMLGLQEKHPYDCQEKSVTCGGAIFGLGKARFTMNGKYWSLAAGVACTQAKSIARMPVRKIPSNVPAPPIDAIGAPSPWIAQVQQVCAD